MLSPNGMVGMVLDEVISDLKVFGWNARFEKDFIPPNLYFKPGWYKLRLLCGTRWTLWNLNFTFWWHIKMLNVVSTYVKMIFSAKVSRLYRHLTNLHRIYSTILGNYSANTRQILKTQQWTKISVVQSEVWIRCLCCKQRMMTSGETIIDF